MRIPLNPGGRREMAAITVLVGMPAVCAFAASGVWAGWAVVGGILAVVWLAGILFFRDPDRRIPPEATSLVGPADGKVVEVTDLDDHEIIGGPARRIGIFLSILDVHVNRSPCAGMVREIRYEPGRYLDARHPDAGRLNEASTIIIDPDAPHAGPMVVRQVAGLIARRIVCTLRPGDRVAKGQRIGMIKFGSRTELIVPGGDLYRVEVAVGDRCRGGSTVLAELVELPGGRASSLAAAGSR